ncbi:MAG TPA: PAS domain S-box protein [Stenomitos sp.]
MANVSLTVTVPEQELKLLEDYCHQTSRTKTDVIRDYLSSIHHQSKDTLLSEIASLRQQLAEVKQEKADLEVLLETTVDHSSSIEAELHDEAEEARRESEERFRAISEATPVPLLISRVSDGEILYANAASRATFGFPVEELLGRSSLDLYYDASERQKLLDVFFGDGSVQNYQLRSKKADGTPFWVTVSLRSLRFNGESTILCAFNDITDRKQAEEALQQAKEQLEAVLNAVPGPISWMDAEGLYLGVNHHLAESLSLPPEAIIGKEVGFFNGNSPFAQFMHDFLASSETAASHELEGKGKDSVRYYLIAAQKYQQGSATVTVGIDITERKRAEESLRIAEENYRSIFENALEGIFQSTPDGYFIRVNPAMARIYGYSSAAEMITTVKQITTQVYVDPVGREEFKHRLEEQGEVKGWEYQVYRKDGSIIWVEENTRAVRDNNGTLLYYEGIIEDVTQRKQREEALQRQVKELRIEIDKTKQSQKVAAIVESDSFQNLKEKLKRMKKSREEREKQSSNKL